MKTLLVVLGFICMLSGLIVEAFAFFSVTLLIHIAGKIGGGGRGNNITLE